MAFRYRTKSLDHDGTNHWTMTCRLCYIEVNHCVIPFHNLEMSNGLSDIEQNHWTMTAQITGP